MKGITIFMNNNELNEFIERYATQYTTKTAVLLTGEWGSGKSYYINNSLCPYLKEHKVKCVVVSLYGIDNLPDLSKQIYLNLRCPPLANKSEAKEYVSIVGHSIINNALSFKGVNINTSEKQLQKLFDSVNLENVLLVIEDVERSSIDILKLLGFINGIVEYDGAKVLLVANEKELLKINDTSNPIIEPALFVKPEIKEETSSAEDENAVQYKRIKEKTIGDTILFSADVVETVKSIIGNFHGVWTKTLTDTKEIEKISNIVITSCNRNFRLLIYALQKCNDIFSLVPNKQSFDDTFYQVTFEGVLMVAGKFISSNVPKWEGTQHISTRLGSSKSPLFRFAYDYLRWGTLDPKDVKAASEEYENYRYFEKNATRENDEDLYILDSYYTQTEENVFNSLKNIEKKLKKKDYVGLYAYEKIGYLAIKAGELVGYDTSKICSTMVNNARRMCQDQKLSSQAVIWGIYGGESDKKVVQDKYQAFMKELKSAIESYDAVSEFSYKTSVIHDMYLNACSNKQQYIKNHSFIGQFEPSKLVSMLSDCTAQEIDDFRGILFVYYRDVAKNEYDESDRTVLEQLLLLLNRKIKGKHNWDKVQLLQIDYLISNIKEFIEKMK